MESSYDEQIDASGSAEFEIKDEPQNAKFEFIGINNVANVMVKPETEIVLHENPRNAYNVNNSTELTSMIGIKTETPEDHVYCKITDTAAYRCEELNPNQTELHVKIEENVEINGYRQIDVVKIEEDCAIIKKECVVEVEDLEVNKTRCEDELSPNLIESLVKIEKREAIDEFVPMYVNVEDGQIKNEFIVKDEDFESNKNRISPNYVEKDEINTFVTYKNHQESRMLKGQPIQLDKPVNDNKFKCDQCDYQTDREHGLKIHLRRHMNRKEVKRFQCNHCDYQTGHKYTLQRHLLRHKNPQEVNMFKCNQCEYQAKTKYQFKVHHLKHMNPEEINMYKCDSCDYQTPGIHQLNRHLLRHKNPEDMYMFRCNQCSYQTTDKGHLKRHLLRHKDPEQVDVFKCNQCDYQSIYKTTLKVHQLLHMKPGKVSMFKCDQCSYKTMRKWYLKTHLRRHMNPEEVNMFKCNQCSFQTIHKRSLKRHRDNHDNPAKKDVEIPSE